MTKGVATNIGIHRQNGNDQGGGGGGNSIVSHLSFLTHSACQYDVT